MVSCDDNVDDVVVTGESCDDNVDDVVVTGESCDDNVDDVVVTGESWEYQQCPEGARETAKP